MSASAGSNPRYTQEVERLRDAGVVGRSGRLRELFDYLANRGEDAEPASQADIALAVFNQSQSDADDATVRVYVHRLRKKLDDHYVTQPPASGQLTLEIPAGIYALRATATAAQNSAPRAMVRLAGANLWLTGLAALLIVALALGGGYWLAKSGQRPNAIWQPVIEAERPVLLVLGDYYMFGEIDPVRPDEGRLIRDFRVNSSEDLLRLQEAEPERYGYGEDFGINYLPFSAAYGISNVAPLLEANGKSVTVIAASALESDMLNYFDVVYVGLLSGLALLEDQTFDGSGLRIGESYDELIDRETGEIYVSSEARSLASPAFYRDYAYLARYKAQGGALVTVIAAERDTGLRGLSQLVASADLSDDLQNAAENDAGFEALVQVTGQQGADLNQRLIFARNRD